MTNQTTYAIEEKIETLTAGNCSDAPRIEKLGRLCGALAVEVCYDPDSSHPGEWEPADGDIEALEELCGGDPYRFGDEEGDRTMDLFCQAYHEGVRETVKAIA